MGYIERYTANYELIFRTLMLQLEKRVVQSNFAFAFHRFSPRDARFMQQMLSFVTKEAFKEEKFCRKLVEKRLVNLTTQNLVFTIPTRDKML